MSNILFVGAHPDDVELGCAGTINKLVSDGKNIKVVTIAEGSSARYDNFDNKSLEITNAIDERKKKSIKSLKSLGVGEYSFYDLPCGRLNTVPLLKINKIIESEIQQFRPSEIYTHSSVDTNFDHNIVFQSTRIAARPSAFPFVKSIFCYEVLSSTENSFIQSFKPNLYISLTRKDLDKKKNALEYYDTEMRNFPNSRSQEGVEVLARFRGMQVNQTFCEAFELLRSIR